MVESTFHHEKMAVQKNGDESDPTAVVGSDRKLSCSSSCADSFAFSVESEIISLFSNDTK